MEQSDPIDIQRKRENSLGNTNSVGFISPPYLLCPPTPPGITQKTTPAAVDIGGSLIKIVYWNPPNPPKLPTYITLENQPNFRESNLTLYPMRKLKLSKSGPSLRFLKLPTTSAEPFVQFLKSTKLHEQYGLTKLSKINATGGGSFKYSSLVRDNLGLEFIQYDEMKCLVKGINFLLHNHENEAFSLEPSEDMTAEPVIKYMSVKGNIPFPYLLVNVGSGVSFLKITGDDEFERVSGSSIGGGTFWGLTRLLTSYTSFDQVIEACKPDGGDNKAVDAIVSDIYGPGENAIGLEPSLTASYFGKVQRSHSKASGTYKDQDIAKSLIYMVADNVAQLGYILSEIHGVSMIVFTGGFIIDNACVWQCITKAVNYWSKGSTSAMFLTHNGYLCALGALLSDDLTDLSSFSVDK